MTDERLAYKYRWYTKINGKVHGKFKDSEIHEFIMSGRIPSTKHEVTLDGYLWEPIHQVPELLTYEIMNKEITEKLIGCVKSTKGSKSR